MPGLGSRCKLRFGGRLDRFNWSHGHWLSAPFTSVRGSAVLCAGLAGCRAVLAPPIWGRGASASKLSLRTSRRPFGGAGQGAAAAAEAAAEAVEAVEAAAASQHIHRGRVRRAGLKVVRSRRADGHRCAGAARTLCSYKGVRKGGLCAVLGTNRCRDTGMIPVPDQARAGVAHRCTTQASHTVLRVYHSR